MKLLPIYSTIAFLIFSLFADNVAGANSVNPQDTGSPTPSPTYDPLAEPVLPENPTDLELGHFWFWHNCMTCHGDVGQGLTDEFRGIWPEDHQNCWAHGCHNEAMDGGGFPIPTYVPPLVRGDKLTNFSQQGLLDYLISTHPPQTPGVLEDEQYLAIVLYLFSMNERPLEEAAPVPTQKPTQEPTSVPTPTTHPVAEQVSAADPPKFPIGIISVGIILLSIVIWRFQTSRRKE